MRPGFLFLQNRAYLLLRLNIFMNRRSGFFSCTHCLNDGCSANDNIPAGPDTFAGSFSRFVCNNISVLVCRQPGCCLVDEGIGAVARCDDCRFDVKNEFASGDRNRFAPPGCIGFAKFHLLTFHSNKPAVVPEKTGWIREKQEFNPFLFTMMNLFFSCW